MPELTIPISSDAGTAELAVWSALVDQVTDATVQKVNDERGYVNWSGVEDQHVHRAAAIACDLLIGRRQMPS